MAESSVQVQIKELQALIASPKRRGEFLVDPRAYAQKNKVSFDPAVVKMTQAALSRLEEALARIGAANPHLPTNSPLRVVKGGPLAARGVTSLAASAAVAAAAAVVSAVAAVTQATSAAKSVK